MFLVFLVLLARPRFSISLKISQLFCKYQNSIKFAVNIKTSGILPQFLHKIEKVTDRHKLEFEIFLSVISFCVKRFELARKLFFIKIKFIIIIFYDISFYIILYYIIINYIVYVACLSIHIINYGSIVVCRDCDSEE